MHPTLQSSTGYGRFYDPQHVTVLSGAYIAAGKTVYTLRARNIPHEEAVRKLDDWRRELDLESRVQRAA